MTASITINPSLPTPAPRCCCHAATRNRRPLAGQHPAPNGAWPPDHCHVVTAADAHHSHWVLTAAPRAPAPSKRGPGPPCKTRWPRQHAGGHRTRWCQWCARQRGAAADPRLQNSHTQHNTHSSVRSAQLHQRQHQEQQHRVKDLASNANACCLNHMCRAPWTVLVP